MVHGRATRGLSLSDSTNTLASGCFLRDKPNEAPSVVCAIALPQAGASATFKLSMTPSRYGLVVPAGAKTVVEDLMTGETLGSFNGTVTYSASVAPFSLRVLKVFVQQ
eukprot:Hpha_TRINITY_DN10893_c0_g1::TRINITY_DN10893_c0_g1_i1::g.23484::m.23484